MTKPVRNTSSLLGIPIAQITLGDAVDLAIKVIETRDAQLCFACANPHSLVAAQSDTQFRKALCNTDLVVPDGTGISVMSRILNIPMGARITGEDFFLNVMAAIEHLGHRKVFFFGSTEHVLKLVEDKLEEHFPHIEVCGTLSPPFGEWSDCKNREMINIINKATPDLLWVGMTAPKQEKWVEKNRHELHVSLIGSIGAVFDFFAGTHPRAPRWMCNAGLEWLYRLCREPKRMWRRNFVSTPYFIFLVVRKHLPEKWINRT